MTGKDQDDLVIIDIRPKIQFDKKSIINSINMPGVLLKSKTFLKDKKLVLVDAGIDYCTVISLAQDLTKSGFAHIYALEGGISYYQFKNNRLQIIEDSLEARYGLEVVSLQKVLHCREQSPLLIDIRDEESYKKSRIEGSLGFPYKGENKLAHKEAFEKAVDDLIGFIRNSLDSMIRTHEAKIEESNDKQKDHGGASELSNETRYPVILIDSDGRDTPRLARMLSRKGINAFYLIGGMESWHLYVYEIPAARKREYLKEQSGCRECGK